jgi:hypothetical protein
VRNARVLILYGDYGHPRHGDDRIQDDHVHDLHGHDVHHASDHENDHVQHENAKKLRMIILKVPKVQKSSFVSSYFKILILNFLIHP